MIGNKGVNSEGGQDKVWEAEKLMKCGLESEAICAGTGTERFGNQVYQNPREVFQESFHHILLYLC